MTEYQQAQAELQQAQHNFDHADAAHIDIAIHELNVAYLKYDVALRAIKGRAS